ncbi:MAG TPA: helix-turn-helix domain-containing protein [Microvirga sp.]|jgi:AraC-like DNA-binding protein|nr:helix-turn-helix domain-containing protein [Microvirga sp.]
MPKGRDPQSASPQQRSTRAETLWSAPTAALHAEPIAPSLSEREWVLSQSQEERRAHAFLILSRGGTLLGEELTELPSPSLLWLPSHGAWTVRVNAGARGYMLSVDDDFLNRTISGAPEGALLRSTTSRITLVPAQRLQDRAEEIGHSFQALAQEVRAPDRGSMAIVGAHVTLICLHLWRMAQVDGSAEAGLRGTGHHVLQQFRQLVELRYREHWSITRYADALGVTEDRLHAVCARNAGQPPRSLVFDRMVQDACMRLQQMDVPVEQIAFSLGFKDPGYFNRFFKKHVGVPPGAYRRRAKSRRAGSTSSYAAWP